MKKIISVIISISVILCSVAFSCLASSGNTNVDEVAANGLLNTRMYNAFNSSISGGISYKEIHFFFLRGRYEKFGENFEISLVGYNAQGERLATYSYPEQEMRIFVVNDVEMCESVLLLGKAGLSDDVTEYELKISAGSLVKANGETNEEINYRTSYEYFNALFGTDTKITGLGEMVVGNMPKLNVTLTGMFGNEKFGKQVLPELNRHLSAESTDTEVFTVNERTGRMQLKSSGDAEISIKLCGMEIGCESVDVASIGEEIKMILLDCSAISFASITILFLSILSIFSAVIFA